MNWVLMAMLLYAAAWCFTSALYILEWRGEVSRDIELPEVIAACFLVGPMWPVFLPSFVLWKAISH